jgi:hypothetical protein
MFVASRISWERRKSVPRLQRLIVVGEGSFSSMSLQVATQRTFPQDPKVVFEVWVLLI